MHVEFETITFVNEKQINATVSANVTVIKDSYGTGDSPTEYEINALSVVDENGNDVVNYIDEFTLVVIEDSAIKQCDSDYEVNYV